jgi:hypothetical protein
MILSMKSFQARKQDWAHLSVNSSTPPGRPRAMNHGYRAGRKGRIGATSGARPPQSKQISRAERTCISLVVFNRTESISSSQAWPSISYTDH